MLRTDGWKDILVWWWLLFYIAVVSAAGEDEIEIWSGNENSKSNRREVGHINIGLRHVTEIKLGDYKCEK